MKKLFNKITYQTCIAFAIGAFVGMFFMYYSDSVTLKTLAPSPDCTSIFAIELSARQTKMCKRMMLNE